METSQFECSFCGKKVYENSEDVIIQGIQNDAKICIHCVVQAWEALKGYQTDSSEVSMENFSMTSPSSIKRFLDEYVIGQDYAKTVLSVAIYNHYKLLKYKEQKNPAVEIDKSNICLVGPTGSGKTYLLKTIAKMLDVPFAMGDATSLTQAG